MIKIRGRYTGKNIILFDPISLPPDTEVEILISEVQSDSQEQKYWEELMSLGLVKETQPNSTDEEPFVPVTISGKPLSETIIEERR
jgi:hypothetical protein